MPLALQDLLRCAVLGVLILVGSMSAAQMAGAQDSEMPDPCTNSPDDHVLRTCRARDLEQATTELKSVADDLSRSLTEGLPGNAEALAVAQSDWERFVRSECKLINFESLSGTAGDIYEMDCLSTMTRARTKLLRELLDSP